MPHSCPSFSELVTTTFDSHTLHPPTTPTTPQINSIMGVTRITHVHGSGPSPAPGQTVVIEYTGWLKDASQPENKGQEFDSSVGQGDFSTQIGIGKLIRGWDEAVLDMRVGERATLDITSDYGYGEKGFRGHIPPNADLIFDVYLKAVQ
ncbi:FK506-binding protein 1B [Podospora bellae-mahoneyi]|uniref:peptidylprolyl isomerase n=1 Tax=Podospora bellae-mahoneyi TaxID=2093777 RepID=A0ABR0FNG5_9PEZI|nr:FK506-binding protein 1B [Podospora bellae-mahoneyi]